MGCVIAIVGMCGSGKSVASAYLEEKSFKKVYFGGVTMDKLKKENLEVTPENEKMMREKLRDDLGMAAFAKILLPKIKDFSNKGNVVLDGLYSWDELTYLKEYLDVITIAIVADKNIRYDRLTCRSNRPLTNSEANKRDISEIENIAKSGPIAYADYYILNNGSIKEFHERLDVILNSIGG